jgi:hypothetical protein
MVPVRSCTAIVIDGGLNRPRLQYGLTRIQKSFIEALSVVQNEVPSRDASL